VEGYFEEEEEEQQQQKPQQKLPQQTLPSKITIPPALLSLFFSRPKKGHSAPDVMWACA